MLRHSDGSSMQSHPRSRVPLFGMLSHKWFRMRHRVALTLIGLILTVGLVPSSSVIGSGFRPVGGGISGGSSAAPSGPGGGGGGGSGGGRGGGGPTFDPIAVAMELANSQNGTPQQSRGPEVPIETQLARFLVGAAYQNWAPFHGSDGEFTESRGPHGVFHRTYLNRAAASGKEPAQGSIVVHESYARDKRKLLDVVVMCRIPNFDPEHGDWFWVKYRPDGVVSRLGQTKLAGQVVSCIDCHQKAPGDDFVYGNSISP